MKIFIAKLNFETRLALAETVPAHPAMSGRCLPGKLSTVILACDLSLHKELRCVKHRFPALPCLQGQGALRLAGQPSGIRRAANTPNLTHTSIRPSSRPLDTRAYNDLAVVASSREPRAHFECDLWVAAKVWRERPLLLPNYCSEPFV
jgi:hypothetical protein